MNIINKNKSSKELNLDRFNQLGVNNLIFTVVYTKEKYKWTLWFGDKSLMICKKCAIREAFGTKYKQNKRYIQWMERRSK